MRHCTGRNKRLLRVVEHVSKCVHTDGEVAAIHSHRLFTHRCVAISLDKRDTCELGMDLMGLTRLIRVSWALIVVGKRNDRRANAEDDGGMDLHVGIGG